MNRRDVIQLAGQSALGAIGAGLPMLGRAQDRFANYKGQLVRMSIPAHPHYDAMVKLLPEFTKQTGIKVEFDRQPVPRMKELQLAELAKPQGDFDLVCYVVMWKGEYVKKNLIQELTPFLKNPALADPDYDIKDVVPRYIDNIGMVGGPKGYLPGAGAKLYGMPYGAETSLLAYRRDLFTKYKLTPPVTYDELINMLPIVRERTGLGALTSRGQVGHQCIHAWLLHLNPLGGKVFDDKWNPTFNNEAGIKALKTLKLIADTGPAGITGFSQGDMNASFLQGQAAMYLDSSLIFGQVLNPAVSKIDKLVSYTLHPKDVRNASQSGGLGLAIPKNAKNADAGFLLMQWLTSKAQDKAVCMLGGVPHRNSTLRDPEMFRLFPEYLTLRLQLLYSEPDWRPIIPEWDEINTQALGVAVHEALTGKQTPEKALDSALPKVMEIMRRGSYYKTDRSGSPSTPSTTKKSGT